MKKIAVVLSMAILLISGCSKEKHKENQPKKESIEKNQQVTIPKFSLNSLDGKKIEFKFQKNRLISNSNKIIILDFFATWCPACKAEIPYLVDLQKRYKDKIKIIGVLLDRDKDSQKIKDFIEKFHINYFVSISNDNYDLARTIYSFVQAPSDMPIPMMVMFKDSKYIIHYIGATPEEMIESDIKKVIGE